MSVGKRRRRAAARVQAERQHWADLRLTRLLRTCRNCGERGPHLIPAGFGSPSMYICEPKVSA